MGWGGGTDSAWLLRFRKAFKVVTNALLARSANTPTISQEAGEVSCRLTSLPAIARAVVFTAEHR